MKLTDENKIEIYRLKKKGYLYKELAKKFKINCKCQSKYVKKIQNKNVHFIHLPSGKNLLVYKNFQLF